ncbi:mutator type transposase [Tanacetum coccineum]|uniref:Mutator type transposase n=1 Tax=Tanacetum coccineum TaxID=301880 RepID=A0ABQ5IKW3_9ASTR
MKYINGNITFVDMIDSDEFSVHEIDSMLEDLGQDGHRVMFYHFLKPSCDLDNGLEPIACDSDVVVLDGDRGRNDTGGIMKYMMREKKRVDDVKIRNGSNSGHVVETEGEENEQAVETESEEDTEAFDETDSEDSDYLVDEENNVDDVDVDMKDFDFHVDEGVEFMGCRDSEQTVDIEEGDGEEIEVLDNDYFESASDSDDEGSRLRKRKLKEIRKQAHANEQIYKTYFYVGKDFPNKEDVMAYIKEHSIETRREIRFEKNDGERVRAVCRGVIPCLPCVDEITSGANQVIGPSQGSGPSQVSGPSEGIGSKVKWTKKKIAVTRSPQKLTINGGKPNSKKQLDGNQCPWVLLVSKIKNSETWQVRTYKSEHKCLQTRKNIYATYQWLNRGGRGGKGGKELRK